MEDYVTNKVHLKYHILKEMNFQNRLRIAVMENADREIQTSEWSFGGYGILYK